MEFGFVIQFFEGADDAAAPMGFKQAIRRRRKVAAYQTATRFPFCGSCLLIVRSEMAAVEISPRGAKWLLYGDTVAVTTALHSPVGASSS